MKNNVIIGLLFLIAPIASYAFFCPTNFSQISEGMTPDQVIAICGKPTKQETKEDTENVPQEWSYFITQQVVPTSNTDQTTGTLKMSVMFDSEGKAINITSNGLGVGATTACGVGIQLGSTRDEVKNACGKPATIAKNTNDASQLGGTQPPTKTTTFTYGNTTLKFVNGKLTSGQ